MFFSEPKKNRTKAFQSHLGLCLFLPLDPLITESGFRFRIGDTSVNCPRKPAPSASLGHRKKKRERRNDVVPLGRKYARLAFNYPLFESGLCAVNSLAALCCRCRHGCLYHGPVVFEYPARRRCCFDLCICIMPNIKFRQIWAEDRVDAS